MLVGQESRCIEVFRRTDEGWILTEAGAGESIKLRSLGIELAVDEVYFDSAA